MSIFKDYGDNPLRVGDEDFDPMPRKRESDPDARFDFKAICIEIHNDWRMVHGLPPIVIREPESVDDSFKRVFEPSRQTDAERELECNGYFANQACGRTNY